MMKLFKNLFRTQKKDEFQEIIERQLRENKETLESLRDYDEGKKEISTRKLEKRLSDIRISS